MSKDLKNNNQDNSERKFHLVLMEWFLILLVISSLIGFSLKVMF